MITPRTISQLPFTNRLAKDDLFEVSKHINGSNPPKYWSSKIDYETFFRSEYNDLSGKMKDDFGISANCIVNLSDNADKTNTTVMTLSGAVENVKEGLTDVKNKVSPTFSPSDSRANAYVNPTIAGAGRFNGEFYSMQIDETIGNQTNDIELHESGQFICYGWLTGSKSVSLANAYVALLGEIGDNLGNRAWALLQLQPWIAGANAQYMQYVCFNIPVSAGLKIRIMTGFKITDFSQSFGSQGLVYNPIAGNSTNTPNTFMGYVIT